jgi:hypothetical protein
MDENKKQSIVSVIATPKSYFNELVGEALEARKFVSTPHVQGYLVGVLESNLTADNMVLEKTLAETLLTAAHADRVQKIEKLKHLADTTLYISGFFGDSLRRKIVDVDYYADIGGAAYAALASEVGDDFQSHVFGDLSRRFLGYVDILTAISQKAMIQTNQDLLRLYERYVAHGSELAKEQLISKGLIPNSDGKKISNQ